MPLTWRGTRTWGSTARGATQLVTGTYPEIGAVSSRLLATLPSCLVVRAGTLDQPVVGWLVREAAREEPGQQAVLNRLLDLLLVTVLRSWFARSEAGAPGWYAAHGDAIVGPALRLLQAAPEQAWTVSSLAAGTGASRAVLARRFTALVGEPPMTYLTRLRLDLAADLLCEPGATLTAVARKVGYGSPFALSTAFKRKRGISPARYRDACGCG